LSILNLLDAFVKPIKGGFLAIAAFTLAVMMLLTALDVVLRYLFSSPIHGGLELVEYMMAVVVPFAVTIAAYEKAHVGVDLIMDRFSSTVQNVVAVVTTALMLVFFILITWQCFIHIAEQYHSGLTSAVLLIPHYPFVASLTAAFALLTVITLIDLLRYLSKVLN
jgi:TRAP-type C4-dicarboxylate transport system permease small subunit